MFLFCYGVSFCFRLKTANDLDTGAFKQLAGCSYDIFNVMVGACCHFLGAEMNESTQLLCDMDIRDGQASFRGQVNIR